MFQSAPLAEARGDVLRLLLVRALFCFNPLPLPKQGEISEMRLWTTRGTCFNPLPLPKQGEMLVAVTSKCSAGYTGRYAIQSNSG